MSKNLVEVFTAGCPLCDETVKLVRDLACSSCEVKIYDLHAGCASDECLEKKASYGINRIPAVVVNGQLAECCQNQQPVSREMLIAAGIGQG